MQPTGYISVLQSDRHPSGDHIGYQDMMTPHQSDTKGVQIDNEVRIQLVDN